MRKIELECAGIKATCRNKREEKLVIIFNSLVDGCVDHMICGDNIGKELLKIRGVTHWEVEQLQGLLSSMFFLEMIDKPFSSPHRVILEKYVSKTGKVPDIWETLYGEREVSA